MASLDELLDACIRDIQEARPGSFIERADEGGRTVIRLIGVRNAEAFQERFGEEPEGFEVVNLADPAVEPPLGFFVLNRAESSLFTCPLRQKLTTDLDAEDGPLRALESRESSLLVHLWDGTLGWIDRESLVPAERQSHWFSLRSSAHDPVLQESTGSDWMAVVQEARSYLGVPYVLGGRSRSRIDCSGLTSRVLRDCMGVILPRHSTDQRRWGKRVSRSSMQAGDLIFARWETTNVPHVGWVSEGGDTPRVIHASQEAGNVVEEPLEQFLEGYRFMGCKRLAPEKEKA